MKKTILKSVALLSLMTSGTLLSFSQFIPPLSLSRGVAHYPFLEPVDSAWWYDAIADVTDCCKESCWNVTTWAGSYYRCFSEAFFDPCDNGTTRKTASLSAILFGRESFTGQNIFAGGILSEPTVICTSCANPFLGFAQITPQFSYTERGAVFGMYADYAFGCEKEWRIGGRISLPFKVIEVTQNPCNLEETLDDVVAECPINFDAPVPADQVEFAYRLDFLRSIAYPSGGTFLPGIQFGIGTGQQNDRTLSTGNPIDGPSAVGEVTNVGNAFPSAYVIKRDGGLLPCPPFRRTAAQVNGALPASGDGSLPNDSVWFFQDTTNYRAGLGQNPAAQRELFLIPRRKDAPDELFNNTNDIRQRIKTLLEIIGDGPTAIDFFRSVGIDLSQSQRIAALGDLDTEFFVGYHPCDGYIDLIVGAIFPTGKS